jgi:hypothetical protein
MGTYLAALEYKIEGELDSRIGIFLRLLPDESQYTRVMLDQKDTQTFHSHLVDESLYGKIFVRQKFSGVYSASLIWRRSIPSLIYGFWLRTLPSDLSCSGGNFSISPLEPFPDHQ